MTARLVRAVQPKISPSTWIIYTNLNSEAIVTAVQEAVLPLQEEIANLKDKFAKLRCELNEVKVKANSNKQYARRNSIRISGLNEEEGADCCDKVLNLWENKLEYRYVGMS